MPSVRCSDPFEEPETLGTEGNPTKYNYAAHPFLCLRPTQYPVGRGGATSQRPQQCTKAKQVTPPFNFHIFSHSAGRHRGPHFSQSHLTPTVLVLARTVFGKTYLTSMIGFQVEEENSFGRDTCNADRVRHNFPRLHLGVRKWPSSVSFTIQIPERYIFTSSVPLSEVRD